MKRNLLFAAILSVPWTWLVVWRWNHEMVRVYDFPPIRFWFALPVMLAISLLFVLVYEASGKMSRQR